MVITYVSTWKASKDISRVWVNLYISSIASDFSCGDAISQAMIEMDSSEDWGVLPLVNTWEYMVNMKDVLFQFMNAYSHLSVIAFLSMSLKSLF